MRTWLSVALAFALLAGCKSEDLPGAHSSEPTPEPTEEPNPHAPEVLSFTATPVGGTGSTEVEFSYEVADANGEVLTCFFNLDGTGAFELELTPCSSGTTEPYAAQIGTYDAYLRVQDVTGAYHLAYASYSTPLESALNGVLASAVIEGIIGNVHSVEWSPDGARIAISERAPGRLKIWNLATGRVERILHDESVGGVAWSPDGVWLAAHDGTIVRIWSTATWSQVGTVTVNESYDGRVSFSPDSDWLAADASDGVRVVHVPEGTLRATIQTVYGPKFSPDGAWLATSDNNATRIFAAGVTGTVPANSDIATISKSTFDWSPDGSEIATYSSTSGRIDFHETTTFTKTGEINALGGTGLLLYSPDGQYLLGPGNAGSTTTRRVFDLSTGLTVATLGGHVGGTSSAAWSPDSTLLASAAYGDIGAIPSTSFVMLFDDSFTEIGRYRPEPLSLDLAMAPDASRLASADEDGGIRLLQPANGVLQRRLTGHVGGANAVRFSPDGTQLATVGNDQTLRVWHAATGLELLSAADPAIGLAVAWSADGSLIATGTEGGRITVRDAATLAEVVQFVADAHAVNALDFSADGRLAAGYEDGYAIGVWDPQDGTLLAEYAVPNYDTYDVRWNPQGTMIAAGGSGTALPLVPGNASLVFPPYTWSYSSSFSPGGRYIAAGLTDFTGSGDRVEIWDLANQTKVTTLSGFLGVLSGATWSADGRYAAASASEGRTLVWRTPF